MRGVSVMPVENCYRIWLGMANLCELGSGRKSGAQDGHGHKTMRKDATTAIDDTCPDWVNRSKTCGYSITSSARASNAGGTSRPSALALFKLMTSSYLVGACTGKSAGFSPLRMRST